jgi:hypothetical protein
MADPLKRKRSLYQNTEGEQEEPVKQEAAPIVEQPKPVETPPVSIPPQPIQQIPTMPYPQQGVGQPSMHDRRSEVPFDARYKKENFMIDKRLLPHVYAWIKRNGMSKVDAVNRAWLKILLADGYPIDPNVLDRPFQWEDLPK